MPTVIVSKILCLTKLNNYIAIGQGLELKLCELERDQGVSEDFPTPSTMFSSPEKPYSPGELYSEKEDTAKSTNLSEDSHIPHDLSINSDERLSDQRSITFDQLYEPLPIFEACVPLSPIASRTPLSMEPEGYTNSPTTISAEAVLAEVNGLVNLSLFETENTFPRNTDFSPGWPPNALEDPRLAQTDEFLSLPSSGSGIALSTDFDSIPLLQDPNPGYSQWPNLCGTCLPSANSTMLCVPSPTCGVHLSFGHAVYIPWQPTYSYGYGNTNNDIFTPYKIETIDSALSANF